LILTELFVPKQRGKILKKQQIERATKLGFSKTMFLELLKSGPRFYLIGLIAGIISP